MLWRCVRPSIRLSVTSRCSIKTAEPIELFLAQMPLLAYPTFLTGNLAISKNKGTFLSNFVPNSELSRRSAVSPRPVDRCKCCHLSSTDDCRQFITMSVQLCLQHYGRDVARHGGSSATADACFSCREIPCLLNVPEI